MTKTGHRKTEHLLCRAQHRRLRSPLLLGRNGRRRPYRALPFLKRKRRTGQHPFNSRRHHATPALSKAAICPRCTSPLLRAPPTPATLSFPLRSLLSVSSIFGVKKTARV